MNDAKPLLFKKDGIRHSLHFRYIFDNSFAYLEMWLQQTPRIYETFSFSFVNAKVGTPRFWVKEVLHEIIDGEQIITIFLEGRTLNKHREALIDRAIFDRELGFMDTYHMSEYEIDDILFKAYRWK